MVRIDFDAVIVGAGPEGLAAYARVSSSTSSKRRKASGGARTLKLTRRGFLHDICSAIHPTAAVSPFFCALPLAEDGLVWVYSPLCATHPLDGGDFPRGRLMGEAPSPPVSPIRSDWLERLLTRIAAALARALGYRAQGEDEQALVEIHAATLELFGLPRSMLLSLDTRTVLEVLAAPRLRAAALRLLEEEESILRFQGKVADADALAAWLSRTRAAAGD
jgi:phytoene dehydrogenase-like protein